MTTYGDLNEWGGRRRFLHPPVRPSHRMRDGLRRVLAGFCGVDGGRDTGRCELLPEHRPGISPTSGCPAGGFPDRRVPRGQRLSLRRSYAVNPVRCHSAKRHRRQSVGHCRGLLRSRLADHLAGGAGPAGQDQSGVAGLSSQSTCRCLPVPPRPSPPRIPCGRGRRRCDPAPAPSSRW